MSENHQMPITAIALLDERKSADIQVIDGREEIPLTFKDFTSIYSWPNMGSLRKMAFESYNNGLAEAFVKFKKRRLVLPRTLFKLLKKGNI